MVRRLVMNDIAEPPPVDALAAHRAVMDVRVGMNIRRGDPQPVGSLAKLRRNRNHGRVNPALCGPFRFGSTRKRFASPRPPERCESLARWRNMPVQEIRASSAIERVAYNPATRDLSIWFNGRRRYIYADVPPKVYRELCVARSAGQFVNTQVKGRFGCRADPPRWRSYD